jgi:hypothetical protein
MNKQSLNRNLMRITVNHVSNFCGLSVFVDKSVEQTKSNTCRKVEEPE